MKKLNKQFAIASKWSGLAELTARAIPTIVFIVLARLLTPSDFGVIAASLMIISFAQIIWGAGMNRALIHQQKNKKNIANIVFWTNLVLAGIVYLLIYSFSKPIANIFNDERVISVIRIQGIGVFLASLGSVQTGLLQKDLNFKSLFYVRLITDLIPGLISIPLALFGFGYWALVYSYLGMELIKFITLWYVSSWRPKFQFNTQLFRSLIPYSSWIMIEGVLIWLFLWVDSLIVGNLMGSESLGLYRNGSKLTSTVFLVTVSPLLPVLFSTFSKLKSDMDQLIDFFTKISKAFVFATIPIGVAIFHLSVPVENILFTSEWEGISTVIGMLAISLSFSWMVGANADLFRAIGRPDIVTKLKAITIPIYIVVFYYSVKIGLIYLLWAKIGLAIIMVIVNMWLVQKIIGVSMWQLIINVKWILVASIIMFSLGWLFHFFFVDINNLQYIFGMSGAIVIGFLILFVKEKKFIINITKAIMTKE